jgi:hypothetical protein
MTLKDLDVLLQLMGTELVSRNAESRQLLRLIS